MAEKILPVLTFPFQLIPKNTPPISNKVLKKVKSFFFFLKTKINFFKDSFFPAVIMEWNKIDVDIRNSASCNVFLESYTKIH